MGNLFYTSPKYTFLKACAEGDLSTLKWAMANQPINKEIINEGLLRACENRQLSTIKYLIEECDADIHPDGDNENEKDALCWACYYGDLEVVKCLVEHEADIHVGNDEPLCIACRRCNTEVVKYLVQKGANVRAQGDKPLIHAISNMDYDLVVFLAQNGAV